MDNVQVHVFFASLRLSAKPKTDERAHKTQGIMAENQTQPKEGYIIDYISGLQVKASPEELEATQVFVECKKKNRHRRGGFSS